MNITTDFDPAVAYRVARTRGYLSALPALVVWMLDQQVPSLQVRESDGSQKLQSPFGNLPLQGNAFDGADELYAIVVDTAADFSQQLREDPPIAALHVVARDQNSTGIPGLYRRIPRHVWLLTTEVTMWLSDRADDVPALAGGPEFIDQLHERFRYWDAVYPQAPRAPRLYSRRECEVCGYRTVEAAENVDGRIELKCRRCNQVYEGDLQAAFISTLEAESA